jgi:acetamidase/formamidase
MSTHSLLPDRGSLHGHFSPDLAPALSVDPGDIIRSRTLDASWESAGFDRDPVLDEGHALVGPVFVRGAEPGDALTVEILKLRPARSGATSVEGWSSPVNDRPEPIGDPVLV